MNLLSISVGMIVGLSVLGLVLILLIVLVCSCIGIYNTLVRMRNNCEEAWATIDVYLKKRYDLIPNLVETVKGYAKHEDETLTKVIAARNQAMGATTPEDKMVAENMLSGCLKSLFAVSEAYPDLKADRQFLDLQRQLQSMETDLAQARKYYNGVCKGFNTKIQVFPNNIVAKAMKLTARRYFELDSEEERKNVKVSFS